MHLPELYILRHGETEWNAAGRIQGALDSGLTETGRQQAGRQAEILAGSGVVAAGHDFFVSPQGRARQTADIALAPFGVTPRVDPRLREISLGCYDGLTRDEIAEKYPAAFAEQDPFLWHDTSPDGEGFVALSARVAGFLATLRRPSVIVTHGIASRFLRGAALGLDLEGIGALPGGQGVVYRIREGQQSRLV